MRKRNERGRESPSKEKREEILFCVCSSSPRFFVLSSFAPSRIFCSWLDIPVTDDEISQ